MAALFKKRKARSPSRTASPERQLLVKKMSDMQERQIYPVVLGVHVSDFTQLFEARCGDSSGSEEGLHALDELWKRGKHCGETCSDAQGFFFLKDSKGDVAVVGVQRAGEEEVHLSFKNICGFMATAEATPGSTVWLAQRSLLASGKVNVQSLVQAQKHQEMTRGRDVCKIIRGVNVARLAVMGAGDWTAFLKTHVPFLRIFGVPTFMTSLLSAVNIENVLIQQFRTWLPQSDIINKNVVLLFPIAASTLIILLEAACSFEVLRRDLKACLQSEKKDAYKISYLLLWCLLVVLMVAHIWWVQLSLQKLVGGSLSAANELFSSFLSSMQAFLPTKEWGLVGVVLQQIWRLAETGKPIVKAVLNSVFRQLGLSGEVVDRASQDMEQIIDDTPSMHPKWSLDWLTDKVGLVFKKMDSIMNSTPGKLGQTRNIIVKGVVVGEAGASFWKKNWDAHLQELREAMEYTHLADGTVNPGTYEANMRTLQPTLTFLASLVRLLTSLMLQASHEFRERLCSTGPSIGRSVSPASFVQQAEAKRKRPSFVRRPSPGVRRAEAKRKRPSPDVRRPASIRRARPPLRLSSM